MRVTIVVHVQVLYWFDTQRRKKTRLSQSSHHQQPNVLPNAYRGDTVPASGQGLDMARQQDPIVLEESDQEAEVSNREVNAQFAVPQEANCPQPIPEEAANCKQEQTLAEPKETELAAESRSLANENPRQEAASSEPSKLKPNAQDSVRRLKQGSTGLQDGSSAHQGENPDQLPQQHNGHRSNAEIQLEVQIANTQASPQACAQLQRALSSDSRQNEKNESLMQPQQQTPVGAPTWTNEWIQMQSAKIDRAMQVWTGKISATEPLHQLPSTALTSLVKSEVIFSAEHDLADSYPVLLWIRGLVLKCLLASLPGEWFLFLKAVMCGQVINPTK